MAPVQLVDDPWSHLACIVGGLILSAVAVLWRRPPQGLRAFAFITGQAVFLTAPLAAHLNRYVYGAFPTIDKEGSLLFYLDGVHRRMVLHPIESLTDPAAQLIGVHVGHLWVTEFFDLFLSPFGAFNAQGLLYPILGWFCAWLLLRDVSGDGRVAMAMSFPFGMGLHVFRDLNWYTIEKAAIFWLALWLWALHRAWRDGGRWRWITGAIYLLACWMNLYLGLVAAAIGAVALLAVGQAALRERAGQVLAPIAGPHPSAREGLRRVATTCLACGVAVAPLMLWQALLLGGTTGNLADADKILWGRAALDSFTLVPLQWNRLEVHRSLNLVALGLALFGIVRRFGDGRMRFAVLAAFVLFLVSLGPYLLPEVQNPVYMLLHAVVPGFWRVAKPEVFFHGSWLLLLAVATVELKLAAPERRGLALLYGLIVLAWLVMVRTHPVYPGMTLFVQSELSGDWEGRVFE